jgi:outer membrane lipopolysaccharide assembly protein LptE/RlpB
MKRLVLVLLIPLVVGACGWKARQPTDARQALKDQCVAGDYNACAEIGHMARAEMNAQSTYTE